MVGLQIVIWPRLGRESGVERPMFGRCSECGGRIEAVFRKRMGDPGGMCLAKALGALHVMRCEKRCFIGACTSCGQFFKPLKVRRGGPAMPA